MTNITLDFSPQTGYIVQTSPTENNMKTYSLADLTIKESDIKTPTHCGCGIKLRTYVEKETQICEECCAEMREYYENV